ncbi:MAG: DNA polymerase III subunit chi [Steroidobacteraceae bacterium]
MTQVEFHILSEAGETARLRHACRLVEQAYEQGQRSYVRVASSEEARRMDDALWTFRDQAFIPHEILSASSHTHPRIMAVIGTVDTIPAELQTLLINLSDALPEAGNAFTRICEVVDADPQRKQHARERYRQYREQGCQLETRNQ